MHPCEIFTHPFIPPITPTNTVEEQVEQALGERGHDGGQFSALPLTRHYRLKSFQAVWLKSRFVSMAKVCERSNRW